MSPAPNARNALEVAVSEAIKLGSRAIEMAATAQAAQAEHDKLCSERQEQIIRNQEAASAERLRMHEANQHSIRTIHNRMWALMVLALTGSVGVIVSSLLHH